mmetsp:Transcript_121916/g.221761  ORF Transcript_121916/g.221761 Transcript_121916/m.221761 type:complete len:181 (-) Transcript_121916:228-770(-)
MRREKDRPNQVPHLSSLLNFVSLQGCRKALVTANVVPPEGIHSVLAPHLWTVGDPVDLAAVQATASGSVSEECHPTFGSHGCQALQASPSVYPKTQQDRGSSWTDRPATEIQSGSELADHAGGVPGDSHLGLAALSRSRRLFCPPEVRAMRACLVLLRMTTQVLGLTSADVPVSSLPIVL